MGAVLIDWDENDPLQRCKGESKRANAAVHDYFSMGSGRSLRALVDLYVKQASNANQKPPSTKISTLNTWSLIYSWQNRVARAEEIQRKEDQRRLAEERMERLRIWQNRQEETREADYQLALRLRETANQVLDQAPNFLKTRRKFVPGKNGEPDKEIITVALDAQTAIKAGETASRLARLASELASDIVEEDVVQGESIDEIREKRWKAAMEAIVEAGQSGDDGDPDA